MWVNNWPKVATQWNSGATRDSNRGPRVRIPSALTTEPLIHTVLKPGSGEDSTTSSQWVSEWVGDEVEGWRRCERQPTDERWFVSRRDDDVLVTTDDDRFHCQNFPTPHRRAATPPTSGHPTANSWWGPRPHAGDRLLKILAAVKWTGWLKMTDMKLEDKIYIVWK